MFDNRIKIVRETDKPNSLPRFDANEGKIRLLNSRRQRRARKRMKRVVREPNGGFVKFESKLDRALNPETGVDAMPKKRKQTWDEWERSLKVARLPKPVSPPVARQLTDDEKLERTLNPDVWFRK